MRYHELIERRKRRSAPADVPLETIKEYCPHVFAYYNKDSRVHGDIPLYRGVRSTTSKSILYGDSSSGTLRKSANTSNYYTVMFDHILPSWKDYPDRSRSWICSSHMGTAAGYGVSYIIMPIGNPILGICPREDIWISFKRLFNDEGVDLDDLNSAFRNMANIFLKGKKGTKLGDNEDDMRKLFSIIDSIPKKDLHKFMVDNSKRITFLAEEIIRKYKRSKANSFVDYIDIFLSPAKNGFKLMNLSEYLASAKINDDKEIWFSGPAYFVKPSVLYSHYYEQQKK